MLLRYVHTDGSGHARRAASILQHYPGPVHALIHGDKYVSMFEGIDTVTVECIDNTGWMSEHTPDVLHPALHSQCYYSEPIATYITQVQECIARVKPIMLICDLNVQVALMARMMTIPYYYMRLHGVRETDIPHAQIFQGAEGLIAPYHKEVEREDLPKWIDGKTFYMGSYTGRDLKPYAKPKSPTYRIGVVSGGLLKRSVDELNALADALPEYAFILFGGIKGDGSTLKDSITYYGRVEDLHDHLVEVDAVICTAGNNMIHEIVARGLPAVLIPEQTWFDEQDTHAKALARHGFVQHVESWNSHKAIRDALKSIDQLDLTGLHALYDPDALPKTAQYIEQEYERILSTYQGRQGK